MNTINNEPEKEFLITKTSLQYKSSNKKINAILIGAAGHQGKEYYNLLKNKYNFKALIDSDIKLLNEIYNSTKYLLLEDIKYLDKNIDFDLAIICLPHYLHKKLTLPLIAMNKTIIKEKPLAINTSDIKEYINIMKKYSNIKLFTIVQRNFNPILNDVKCSLNLIGKIYNFNYDYDLNIESITQGWRAEFDKSFGGVLIDMGYHIIDIILTFFHNLISISANCSFCYQEMKKENLEDSINIIFQFKNDISGVININRHSHKKKELFIIRGEKGVIEVLPQEYSIFDRKGNILINKKFSITQQEMKLSMFDFYIKHQNDNKYLSEHFNHHCNVVLVIEKIYQQLRNVKNTNNENIILYKSLMTTKGKPKSQQQKYQYLKEK